MEYKTLDTKEIQTLREMSEKDYDIAIELVGKINRSAKQFFSEACKSESLKKGLIYDSPNNIGAFSVIEKEDFIVSHVAFQEDINQQEILYEMYGLLESVIKEKGNKDLYLNIYNKNPSIVEFFRQYNFKKDTSGIQYRYSFNENDYSNNLENSNLQFRKYESDRNDEYINLLDEAFKPLDTACNIEPYYHKRNRENVVKWLQRVDESDEFGTLWDKERLVSLYIVSNEYIHTLATDPIYQGLGYGSILLDYCMNKLFQKGYKEIYLNCLDENTQAHSFYRKNGFEETGWYIENTYCPLG